MHSTDTPFIASDSRLLTAGRTQVRDDNGVVCQNAKNTMSRRCESLREPSEKWFPLLRSRSILYTSIGVTKFQFTLHRDIYRGFTWVIWKMPDNGNNGNREWRISSREQTSISIERKNENIRDSFIRFPIVTINRVKCLFVMVICRHPEIYAAVVTFMKGSSYPF